MYQTLKYQVSQTSFLNVNDFLSYLVKRLFINANMWTPDKIKPKFILSDLFYLLDFVNLNGYVFMLFLVWKKKSKILYLDIFKTIIHLNWEQRTQKHLQIVCEKISNKGLLWEPRKLKIRNMSHLLRRE